VLENSCFDTQVNKTQEWGLQLGAASTAQIVDIIVRGNDFRDNRDQAVGTTRPSSTALVNSGSGSWGRNQGHSPTVTRLQGKVVPYTAEVIRLDLPVGTKVEAISTGQMGDLVTLIAVNNSVALDGNKADLILRDANQRVLEPGSSATFRHDGKSWREIGF